MTFEPVGGFAELVEVARHDPWVRWGLPRSAPLRGWYDADADAVAVSRTRRPYGTSLFVLPVGATPLGPRTVTAALALVTAGPTGSLTVPGEALVMDLAADDPAVAAELATLLAEHSPRHSVAPGSADVAGWAGVRQDDRLVACAARLELVPGVPLLASVAVHPTARRQGLAAALTAALTRRALAVGSPAVTVDLYADNDAARRVYERLGFVLGREVVSWPL